MENQTDNFSTSDIKIASYLLSKNIPLIGVDRETQKVIFVFDKSNKALKSIKDYLTDKAVCNPRVLFESFGHLKSIIYKEIEI